MEQVLVSVKHTGLQDCIPGTRSGVGYAAKANSASLAVIRVPRLRSMAPPLATNVYTIRQSKPLHPRFCIVPRISVPHPRLWVADRNASCIMIAIHSSASCKIHRNDAGINP
jgi:hypothetical protein